jgi:hypothetical protein
MRRSLFVKVYTYLDSRVNVSKECPSRIRPRSAIERTGQQRFLGNPITLRRSLLSLRLCSLRLQRVYSMEANQLYGGGMKVGASDRGRSLFSDEAEMHLDRDSPPQDNLSYLHHISLFTAGSCSGNTSLWSRSREVITNMTRRIS